LKRALALTLFLSACGANCGQFENSSELCSFPTGVGPDATGGECDEGAICLPSALAPCAGNDCCHNFCSVEGCPSDATCVSLTLAQFEDGGPRCSVCNDAGICTLAQCCTCPDAADGGCTCDADGGHCLLNTCLQVCSSET
jgi:hypothetical protein